MKKLSIWLALLFLALSLVGFGCKREDNGKPPVVPTKEDTIKLGYNTSTVINAHLGLILKQSNIFEVTKIKGEVRAYDSDTTLIEDFSKGIINVAFTSDVPGILGLAKNGDSLILGSFGSLGRVGLMKRPDVNAEFIKDLKGLRIAVEKGTINHFYLLKWLAEEGIIPDKDITIIKSDSGNAKSNLNNRTADAAVFSDPDIRMSELTGAHKRIADGRFTSVVIIKKELYNKNPEMVKKLLESIKTACYYLITHQVELNNLVAKTQKIQADIIPSLAALNSVYTAGSPERINISPKNYINIWNSIANFLYNEKLLNAQIDLNSLINTALLQETEKKIGANEIDLTKIKIGQ
jgi:NitT/TauT family transport system substrate-binding protein